MTLEIMKKEQQKYVEMLSFKEMSSNTIRKYSLAVRTFIHFAEITDHCKEICKDCLIEYKVYLEKKYKPTTSNLYILALNGYLSYLGDESLSIKALKIQSQNILENCFTKDEYQKMLDIAINYKDKRIYHVIRTLANTGMRVKGISHLTVDVIKKGNFTATNKGKTRCLVIPQKICDELIEYCKVEGIEAGYVFRGQKQNNSVSQNSIRRWLKKIATLAGVDVRKAFPHNLRHLFAITYLEKHGNISELADIMGHTNIETTRIYTRTGIEEKRKKMDELDL